MVSVRVRQKSMLFCFPSWDKKLSAVQNVLLSSFHSCHEQKKANQRSIIQGKNNVYPLLAALANLVKLNYSH